MVSMASKIGMFTMFSAMALGRQLEADDAQPGAQDVSDDLVEVLTMLQEEITMLKSKQITGDYFYTNNEEITVPLDDPQDLLCFDVSFGETLDFIANVTTDDNEESNRLRLQLMQGDLVLAKAVEDGNGQDDNLSMSLNYKAKTEAASRFCV